MNRALLALCAAGGVLLIAGLLLGLLSTHPAGSGFASTISCGSPWAPDYSKAKLADASDDLAAAIYGNPASALVGESVVAQCRESYGARGVLGGVLAGLGAATLLGWGFVTATAAGARGTS